MKKLLLIINPVAGKSALRSQLIDIVDIFVKADYVVTTVVTQSREHLLNTIDELASSHDLLVCSGGDGTLNMTVDALTKLENPPVLGYIPGGTTNDFAKTRGISSVPTQAAKQIAQGEIHEVDLGYFGAKPYLYIAAFGALSDVSYETPRQLKQNIGHAAYVLEGVKALTKNKSYNIRFKIDGHEVEGNFIHGMITNTQRVGGFKLPIIGDFLLDDGLVDITLVRKPETADDATKLLNALLTQQPDGTMVFQHRGKSLEYEADKEVPWTVDGEFGGSFKKQNVFIKKRYLKMIY